MTKEYQTITEAIEDKIERFFIIYDNSNPEPGLYNLVISEVEKILIKKTMEHTGRIHSKAAKILGINRNTLRKKIKDFGID